MYDISEHGSWRDHLKKRNAEKRGEDTSQRILRFKGPLSGPGEESEKVWSEKVQGK